MEIRTVQWTVPLLGCEGWVLGAIERGISGYKKYDQGNGKGGSLGQRER